MTIATSPISAGFRSRFQIAFSTNNKIIFEGDSRVYVDPQGDSVSTSFSAQTGNVFVVANVAASGATLLTIYSEYPTQILPLYDASKDNNFLIAAAGGNDVWTGGATLQNLKDRTRNYSMLALLDRFRPVIPTIPLSKVGAAVPATNAIAAEFNAWLLANYKSIGAVGAMDYAAAIDSEALPDGIHYSVAQMAQVAAVAKEKIQTLASKPTKTINVAVAADSRFIINTAYAALGTGHTMPTRFNSSNETAAAAITERTTGILPLLNGTKQLNFCVVAFGSYDILLGGNATTATNNLTTLCGHLVTMGFLPILVVPLPLATGTLYAGSNPTLLTVINFIRDNWQTMGAVGLVDMPNIPNINPDSQITNGAFLTNTQADLAARTVRGIIEQYRLNLP